MNKQQKEQEKKVKKIEEMTLEEKAYRLTLQQLKQHRDVFIRLKDK